MAHVKTQFIQNKQIIEMFKNLIGTGENPTNDISVSYDKYVILVKQVKKFIKLNSILVQSNENHEVYYKYIITITSNFKDVVKPTTDEGCREFNREYQSALQSEIVNLILNVGKVITPYGRLILDGNSSFLFEQESVPFSPFPKIDFKQMAKINVNMTMSFLKNFLEVVKEIHELFITPDISVKNFTKIALHAINELERFIPRCQDAFEKIRNSVSLLEENFTKYYKNYRLENSKPTIILEQFVKDVMMDGKKPKPSIIFQFREILKFYQSQGGTEHQGLIKEISDLFLELETLCSNSE